MNRIRILAVAFAMAILLPAVAQENPGNALVRLSVASLRSEPRHGAELETQALMGAPVELLEQNGEWWLAELPDGYRAYINESAFSEADMERWRSAPRLIGVAPFETHVLSDTVPGSPVVSDFVAGCIVEGNLKPGARYVAVTLPDGRSGYLPSSAVAPFREYMERPYSPRRVVEVARALTGVPYLWGGRSGKMIDCSGLTQLCFFDSGLILPRNASQQALIGEEVPLDSLAEGDMLFFRNDDGRVIHVAVSTGGSHYLHSSGMVHESSMNPADSLYNGREVHFARRLSGTVPAGTVRVIDSPWYFNNCRTR